MLPVVVDPEVESAVDLLKEMYNKVVAAAILKSPIQLQIYDDSFRKKEKEELMLLVKELCDAIAFIENPVTPVAAIDFFVLCIFMASSSDSAASVPPSTPQPTDHLLPPQSTGPPLPSQPTFAPTAHPLEAEPEHPLEVVVAPSKAEIAINLKILINDKYLNTTTAEDAAATLRAHNAPKASKTPKAIKIPPIKLKILMNGKDIALDMTEATEDSADTTAAILTPCFRKTNAFSQCRPRSQEACDVVDFIKSLATPAAVIDFFVLCTFMASPSDSAASVPPSTPLPPQLADPLLHP
ncbi:unnamed protein product [Prunus armeniaca]|uniref:Uncharacterized protein n=1 Tax=Prunus armeniaca TaxID=36596 RepID=A0A6J5TLE4_PRUAR|nr:unnamed protein product [Prunus armeniaca]